MVVGALNPFLLLLLKQTVEQAILAYFGFISTNCIKTVRQEGNNSKGILIKSKCEEDIGLINTTK